MRYSWRGIWNRSKSTAIPFREYRHNLSASLTIRSLREIGLFLVSWPRMIQQISFIFSEGYRKSFSMASAIFAPSASWTLASLGLDGFGPKPVSCRFGGIVFQPTSWRRTAGMTIPSFPSSFFRSLKAYRRAIWVWIRFFRVRRKGLARSKSFWWIGFITTRWKWSILNFAPRTMHHELWTMNFHLPTS